MKAYSKDLRLKVLDAVDRGMPRKEVARIFGISLPSRKAGARTREALDEVMGEALRAVTLEDVAGWFSHCGYEPRDQYS